MQARGAQLLPPLPCGGLGTQRAWILPSLTRSRLCKPGKGCVYGKLQILWVTVPSLVSSTFLGRGHCEYKKLLMVTIGVPQVQAKG